MNTRRHSVSVCLLSFNHAHLLESTVASILAQEFADFELVISDDASTDSSWSLIGQLAQHDRRIRAIRTSGNLGMPGNANFAVAQCAGDYVALLHHDDVCRPDMLGSWVQALDEQPSAAFVFNAYGKYGSNEVYGHALAEGLVSGSAFLRRRLLADWGCPVRGTAMIRRECWNAVGGMRERFDLLADVDLWMRLARLFDLAYVARALIDVRQQRPPDYPVTYGGGGWSWKRHRLLLEIHADNWCAELDTSRLGDRLAWWRFRTRASADTLKWLAYAVVKRRRDMIAAGGEGENAIELAPVRWARRMAVRLAQVQPSA